MEQGIRVLLVDDHEVVRIGLRAIFATTEIQISGEATNGNEVVREVQRSVPDLALISVRGRGSDGFLSHERLRRTHPAIPVLIFSENDRTIWLAQAAKLHASGYMLQTCGREEILSGIRRVAAGEQIWTKEDLHRIGTVLATSISDDDVSLTRRENEVLCHMTSGMSNREIAVALHISYETVKEHVQHILRKLGVADRTRAAVWAVRRGLV